MIDVVELKEAIRSSLYLPEELPDNAGPDNLPDGAVVVEGIMSTFVFHPDRLKDQSDTVRDWLLQLPTMFRQAEGGGWSFLNACQLDDGTLWGEHEHIEWLFCLGIGLGYGKFLLPRDLWSSLPGGMPYYAITVT